MIWLTIGGDLFPLIAGVLAAVTCGLLGNFLVLRKLSLMGDAISHSVLPGLVVAFLVAGSRSPVAMFLGAAIAGVATVVLVEVVKKLGRVEPGAAMGVVFSLLFALGVLLIQQVEHLSNVDLDADCVLHGQLEDLAWFDAPDSWPEVFQVSTLQAAPRQVRTLAVMAVLAMLFVSLLFKELRIAAFDPALATTLGFPATLLHYLLMIFVAAATVASFEAVGSILVIAMLICPAATARLLTDRLGTQIACSMAIALVTAVGGYLAASWIPAIWERDSVNAAGAMSVTSGVLLMLAIVGSPRHGMISKAVRKRKVSLGVAKDDLLAALYRAAEAGEVQVRLASLHAGFSGVPLRRALANAVRQNLVERHEDTVSLSSAGKAAAAEVVRRHRLWEHYLVERAGVAPDHVHETAEFLEHVGTSPPPGPVQDPHGREIPGGPRSS